MQGDSIPANRAFLHVVHGLRVASSIELPDLALADGDTAAGVDVDISEGDVPDSLGDQATVGAGVTTTAPTAVEAMRANATAMDKLIAAAKARGIKAGDKITVSWQDSAGDKRQDEIVVS